MAKGQKQQNDEDVNANGNDNGTDNRNDSGDKVGNGSNDDINEKAKGNDNDDNKSANENVENHDQTGQSQNEEDEDKFRKTVTFITKEVNLSDRRSEIHESHESEESDSLSVGEYDRSSRNEFVSVLVDVTSESDSIISFDMNAPRPDLLDEPDFFNRLESIVSINEFMESLSPSMPVKEEQKRQSEDMEGSFDHPLTGQFLLESKNEEGGSEGEAPMSNEDENDTEETENESYNVRLEDISDDDDLLMQLEAIQEDEPPPPVLVDAEADADQILETLFDDRKLRPSITVDFEERVSVGLVERELRMRVQNFLDYLIDSVVEKAEFRDPVEDLRDNLDREKLINMLCKLKNHLDDEMTLNNRLCLQVTNFFRRKKQFRQIKPEALDVLVDKKKLFEKAASKLDATLGKEQDVIRAGEERINYLETELAEAETKSSETFENFERLVRTTVSRDKSDGLVKLIDKNLALMKRTLDEISSVRIVLLQKQHNLASLQEKIEKLENLGEGLFLINIETLQTELTALDKKTEERNTNLARQQIRQLTDMHILTHTKQKVKMLQNHVKFRKTALANLNDNKMQLREYIYRLKLERTRIRKDIEQISFQGGLIDKPALMTDYDNTVKAINERRGIIRALNEQHESLTERIERLENKFKSIEHKR